VLYEYNSENNDQNDTCIKKKNITKYLLNSDNDSFKNMFCDIHKSSSFFILHDFIEFPQLRIFHEFSKITVFIKLYFTTQRHTLRVVLSTYNRYIHIYLMY